MANSRFEQDVHVCHCNPHVTINSEVDTRRSAHHSHYNRSIARAATGEASSVLEQIANLLNLAQNLMSGFKDQRSSGTHSRRSQRFRGGTPYQRTVLQNANANTNINVIANLNANADDAQLDAAQFCNCGECRGRKMRSEALTVWQQHRSGATVAGNGSNFVSDANFNPTQQHQSIGSSCNRLESYNNNSTNFKCSICLESYLAQRPMATLCGHIFCRLCILECLNRQGKCPICNRKLNLTNVFRVFF